MRNVHRPSRGWLQLYQLAETAQLLGKMSSPTCPSSLHFCAWQLHKLLTHLDDIFRSMGQLGSLLILSTKPREGSQQWTNLWHCWVLLLLLLLVPWSAWPVAASQSRIVSIWFCLRSLMLHLSDLCHTTSKCRQSIFMHVFPDDAHPLSYSDRICHGNASMEGTVDHW